MNIIYVNQIVDIGPAHRLEYYTIRFGIDGIVNNRTTIPITKFSIKDVYTVIENQTVFTAPYGVSVLIENTVYYPEDEGDWAILILKTS